MDRVVVVNEHDEVIGDMPREEAHSLGTPHRIAVVYVTRPDGSILVQVRKGGRLDHSCAGHVDPGEEYIETAYRELKEELSIAGTELSYVGHAWSYEAPPAFKESRTHVMSIYTCRAEPGELEKDAVETVFWANPEEVLREMEADLESTRWSGGFRASLRVLLGK